MAAACPTSTSPVLGACLPRGYLFPGLVGMLCLWWCSCKFFTNPCSSRIPSLCKVIYLFPPMLHVQKAKPDGSSGSLLLAHALASCVKGK